DTVTGAVTETTPDRPSCAANVTVTAVLCQSASFGGGSTEATTVGGVLSMFSVTLADALLPARSVAVPLTTCPAPSAVTVTGCGQLAMPDPSSLQVKVTVTSVLFQPAALGGGAALALMLGGVVSALTNTSRMKPLPGCPRSSTAISFQGCSLTVTSMS